MIGVGSVAANITAAVTYSQAELLLYGPSTTAGNLRGIYSNNGSPGTPVSTAITDNPGTSGAADICKIRVEDHQITLYKLASGTWDSEAATWSTVGTWGLPAGANPIQTILAPWYCAYSNDTTKLLGVRVVPV